MQITYSQLLTLYIIVALAGIIISAVLAILGFSQVMALIGALIGAAIVVILGLYLYEKKTESEPDEHENGY